jgi:hypothetical protein
MVGWEAVSFEQDKVFLPGIGRRYRAVNQVLIRLGRAIPVALQTFASCMMKYTGEAYFEADDVRLAHHARPGLDWLDGVQAMSVVYAWRAASFLFKPEGIQAVCGAEAGVGMLALLNDKRSGGQERCGAHLEASKYAVDRY